MLAIALIIWVVAIPLGVILVTEVGWRVGDRRRARHEPPGALVSLPVLRLGSVARGSPSAPGASR